MKSLLLGSLGLLALAAGGCVGQRYVNTTPYGPAGVPQAHPEPAAVPEVTAEAFNAVRLADAPVGVQSAFRAEHADATVTGVAPRPAGNGVMLYQVTYIDGGVARQSLYQAGGEPAADAPTIFRAAAGGDDYRPAPAPNAARPATRPIAGGF